MKLRIGCASWGLREMALEDQLKLSRQLGFDVLELDIANYSKDVLQLDSSDADIAAVRALFDRYGVSTEYAATGNDFTAADDAENAAAEAKVKRVIDIAAALGAKRLRIFAGFTSDSEVYGARFDRMKQHLKNCAEYAQKYDLFLAVETHGGVSANGDALFHFNTCSTRADMVEKMFDGMPANLGLNFDPANLSAVGEACPEAWAERFNSRINYLHLKDFRDVAGGIVPAACGEGRLDWDKLKAALRKLDHQCALIEYELPADVADGMSRSLKFLESAGLA